jgi:drug/metabolite transporter superfamily protein YnfA
MFDLDDLFEEIDFGLKGSKRGKTIFRIFFGVLGLLLGAAGAWHMLAGGVEGSLHMRATAALMFVFLALFFGINVALHKPWRWPGLGFVVCFVGMFVVRIAFGA